MSQKALELVLEEVQKNSKLLLCTATGNSPRLLYQNMAKESQGNISLFQKMRVIPLDEWIGLPTLEGSCHQYINENILTPLKISTGRYFAFNSNAKQLEKECKRIQVILTENGPIDLCILGLGKNGHLGFNEPANELEAYCHISRLSSESQTHNMIDNIELKPTKGLTLGMQDILSARKIILMVSGKGKEVAIEKLLSKKITNDCPATWLWQHDNVNCLIVN